MKNYLMILIICVLAATSTGVESATGGSEPVTLSVRTVGVRELLSNAVLQELIPETLLVYWRGGRAGQRLLWDRASVEVYPVIDSLGFRIDTASATPPCILLLFSSGDSILKLLKKANGDYEEIWCSQRMLGEGVCQFRDLNGDGRAELLVSLLVGTHGLGNLFIYSWNGRDMSTLNPPGAMGGASAFNGHIRFVESEGSTKISVTHPGLEIIRVYGPEGPSGAWRLVSEKALGEDKE